MKKWKIYKTEGIRFFCLLAAASLLAAGCGKKEEAGGGWEETLGEREKDVGEIVSEEAAEGERQAETGISHESAKDGEVDFPALTAENPDIFAWIYVPGTDIDYPVLQSGEADDFYEDHNAQGEESEEGALYTELANLKNMCDFNTVIHGKGGTDQKSGLFGDLYLFGDPDFFENHEKIYLYLEGNLLTYTIFAAYERENSSLIRSYDFTYGSGCEQFLGDLYGAREMGKLIREEWEEVTPYHFLITLTAHGSTNGEKQFIVVGALTEDAAGEIDRIVEW